MTQRYREYFEERRSQTGLTVHALWNSRESQERRFGVMAAIAPLSGASVLDIGCGFGDFLPYLHQRGIAPARYVGIDIVPAFIEEARKRQPDTEFRVADGITDSATAEWVFASGLFFLPALDWGAHVIQMLTAMWRKANKGVCANFLSLWGKSENNGNYYAHPCAVLELFRGIGVESLALRHDYAPNDFTVYGYRP